MSIIQILFLLSGVLIFFTKSKSIGFVFFCIGIDPIISLLLTPHEDTLIFGLKCFIVFLFLISGLILSIKHDTKGNGVKIKGFIDN